MISHPARTRAVIFASALIPIFGLLMLTSGRALMMGRGSAPPSRIAAPSQTGSLAGTTRLRPFTRPDVGGQFKPAGELSAALSAGSLFVPVIAATKAVDKAAARQGETLTYTVTISNSGADPATNVVFNDTLDANTTLVPGSLIVSPIAVNDAYTTIGNVGISVPAGQGVLANDLNPNGSGTLTVTNAGSFTTANGGAVTLNGDGSFTYNPAAGFRGPTDSFSYTLGNGTGLTNTATVTITINGMIWFIDNSLASNGTGRLSNPFNNLPSFAAINTPGANRPAAGDNIFLFRQVATNYAGPLTLLSNQKLIGQGATASLAVITGLTPPTYSVPLPATGGTNPTIAAAVTNITLAAGNLMRGVTLSNSGGTALTGNNFGTFTAADNSVTNSSGPAINLTTGNLAATFVTVSSTNSTTTGINLSATTGSFSVTGVGSTAGSGGTIQGATNDGITLNNVTNVSFNLITVQNLGGHGISGVTVTGFSLTNSTITDTVNNTTARDSVNFSGLFGTNTINTVSFNGINQDGISVTNSSGTLTGLTISNCTFQNHTAPNGNNGVQITANGNANMTTTITGGTFTHNGNAEEAVIVTTASNYTGTNNVTVQNATFNAGAAFGNGGIVMQADGTGTGNYRALNNTINLTPFTGIAVQATGNATVNGVVTGNNITPRAAANGGNSGDGIVALSDGTGGTTAQRLNVSIQNNIVSAGFGLEGIFVQLREGNASSNLSLTLVNNSVGAPASALVDGIRVLSQDAGTLCARISSNTSAGSAGGVGIRAQRSVLGSTTFNLERGAAALASPPATVLATNNPASTTAAAGTITVVENNTCAAAPTLAQPIEGGGGGQISARMLKRSSAQGGRPALTAFAAPVNDTLGNPLRRAAGRAMASPAGIASAGPALAGETINQPLGTIPPGESVTLTFQATINNPVTPGTTQVSNTGTVSGTGFTPVTTNAAVTTVLLPPTISKAFGALTIPMGGTTSLTFTLINPNPGTQLTGVSFTDPLPAGLIIATPNGLTGSCTVGVTATPGTGSLSLLNATRPAGSSCTFTINVTGATAGVKNNTTGAITSTESGPGGTAAASITVLSPTAAELAEFSAAGYDGGVFLRWQTGFEADNLGFNLYRELKGQRTLLTPDLVAGSALMTNAPALTAGRSYAWWDEAAAAEASYWLEEIDLNGQRVMHGPISPRAVDGPPPAEGRAAALGRLGQGRPMVRPVLREPEMAITKSAAGPRPQSLSLAGAGERDPGAALRARQQQMLAAGPALKIGVREDGWYRIAQPDLVAAGLDAKVDPRRLHLYLAGAEVPLLVTGEDDGRLDPEDGVEFYGQGIDSPYTEARTYWLAGGRARGLRLGTLSAEAEPGGASSFAYTVESRERSVYFAALVNGERENFFGRVVTSQPVEQSMTLTHLDLATEAGAELEVALQGVTDLPHQVKVSVNGAEAGRVSLEGRGWKSERLRLSAGALREGENVIAFAGEAGPSDISLVDYLRLTYQRTYTADQGELLLSVGTAGPQTISGFGGGQVRVLDITRPGAPVELAGKIESQDGNYSVTVNVAGPRTLLALTPDRARKPASLALNHASGWRQHSQGADLIVVTRRELKEALGPLLALRQSQGLSVAVVEVEDLYDEYSFGQKRPQAIKDFLAEAQGMWRRSPRYLLLAGDASFDPKGYLGRGDRDVVPTGLIDTATMEAASDDWLADFDGDGLPELAVGRLPVLTAEEAARVVAKIARYESSEGGAGLLLVADRNDGFDFEGANAALGSLLPAGAEVREIRRGQTDDATARAQLIEGLNAGPRLVNYTGHGSVDFWRGNLLTAGDAAGLANGERPSVFVMMTCLNGYFHDAAVDSLGEVLLKAVGGAAGVWASTGMTGPGDQAVLNQELYRLIYGGGVRRLGEATARAKAAVGDRDVRRTWVLLGDPTTMLK